MPDDRGDERRDLAQKKILHGAVDARLRLAIEEDAQVPGGVGRPEPVDAAGPLDIGEDHLIALTLQKVAGVAVAAAAVVAGVLHALCVAQHGQQIEVGHQLQAVGQRRRVRNVRSRVLRKRRARPLDKGGRLSARRSGNTQE